MKNFKFFFLRKRQGVPQWAVLHGHSGSSHRVGRADQSAGGGHPEKYTEFDLSAAKMYTLGDSSRQLMQSLDQDVTVYYLCETGSEDAIITKLLDHYADESGHFHWEQKDPALYPTFAAQYGAENASTGSLIVVSGENSEVLNAAELYEYDYSDYYTTGAAT